ncbi:ACP S-malonyltransferase [Campylobacter suis]|uniref:Malonyl CoA-acyl carrier protein transacylase n=1 Tax=Campylobacter suis TaxID=2790657 RepID=A0ABN7K1K9_9BACT|nr:ACP S-malonyltransferase [Campylobacter suis]CAD7286355.1 Malonyl CoA-acyl carrier protein transacylase [Campylobacter suis]
MKYAFIFPGQGSQSFGMGQDFYNNSKGAKELLDRASNELNIDFATLLFTENDKLSISEFTQPAIVLNSLMAYKAFCEQINLTPDFSLGHSLGEFSALAISGAFDFISALKIVNLRGKFMQQDCDGKGAGMMVVLGLGDEAVNEICANAQAQGKQAYGANFNCDGQVVVAGLSADLSELESKFKEAGAKRAMLLNMSVASHCPILENASQRLVKELEGHLAQNFTPVISNATAKPYTDRSSALELLKAQLTSPVLYKQSIVQNPAKLYIEFGANVLKGINKKITDTPTLSITDMASLEEAIKFIKDKA